MSTKKEKIKEMEEIDDSGVEKDKLQEEYTSILGLYRFADIVDYQVKIIFLQKFATIFLANVCWFNIGLRSSISPSIRMANYGRFCVVFHRTRGDTIQKYHKREIF